MIHRYLLKTNSILSDIICLKSKWIEKYQVDLCSKYNREHDFDVILTLIP